MIFRHLKPNEIECRVGNVGAKGFSLLLYKNARADMEILDETVGAMRWQRKHYEVKGNMYCSVGICQVVEEIGTEKRFTIDWTWKDDCGTESNTEKEKGEASDSFKRACVNWGIGRELYDSPFIFVPCTTVEKEIGGKKKYELPSELKFEKYSVKECEFNKVKGEYLKLTIVDKKGNVVFSLNSPKPKQEFTKPLENTYLLQLQNDLKNAKERGDDQYISFVLEVMKSEFNKEASKSLTNEEAKVIYEKLKARKE